MTPVWHEVGFRLSLPTGPGTKLIFICSLSKSRENEFPFQLFSIVRVQACLIFFLFSLTGLDPQIVIVLPKQISLERALPPPEKMHAGVRDRCAQTRTIPRQRRGEQCAPTYRHANSFSPLSGKKMDSLNSLALNKRIKLFYNIGICTSCLAFSLQTPPITKKQKQKRSKISFIPLLSSRGQPIISRSHGKGRNIPIIA